MGGEQQGRRRGGFPGWGIASVPLGTAGGALLGTLAGGFLGSASIGAAIGTGLGVGLGMVLLAAAVVVASSDQ
jgi:hypothetical protein